MMTKVWTILSSTVSHHGLKAASPGDSSNPEERADLMIPADIFTTLAHDAVHSISYFLLFKCHSEITMQ